MPRLSTREFLRMHLARFLVPWYRRPIFVLIMGVTLMVGSRLALRPLANHELRRHLSSLANVAVTYDSLTLAIFPPRLSLSGVEVRVPRTSAKILSADDVTIWFNVPELIHRRWAARTVRLTTPIFYPAPAWPSSGSIVESWQQLGMSRPERLVVMNGAFQSAIPGHGAWLDHVEAEGTLSSGIAGPTSSSFTDLRMQGRLFGVSDVRAHAVPSAYGEPSGEIDAMALDFSADNLQPGPTANRTGGSSGAPPAAIPPVRLVGKLIMRNDASCTASGSFAVVGFVRDLDLEAARRVIALSDNLSPPFELQTVGVMANGTSVGFSGLCRPVNANGIGPIWQRLAGYMAQLAVNALATPHSNTYASARMDE